MNSVNVKEHALHKAHTMIKNKITSQSEYSIIPKQPDTLQSIILASSPNLNARVSFSRQGDLNQINSTSLCVSHEVLVTGQLAFLPVDILQEYKDFPCAKVILGFESFSHCTAWPPFSHPLRPSGPQERGAPSANLVG